jgi:flagellar basal body-associated protein FliL
MSDFDLPEPNETTTAEASSLPEGLEPNTSELNGEKKSKKWIWIVVIALVLLLCCCCAGIGFALFNGAENFDMNNFNNFMNEYSMLIP